MQVLDFSRFNTDICNYISRRCCVTEIVLDNDYKKFIIENVINDRNLDPITVHDLDIVRLGKINIISYTVRKHDLSRTYVITQNDKKVFKIENKTSCNLRVNTENTAISLYNPDTNKIKQKMSIEKIDINGFVVYKITTLVNSLHSHSYEKDNYELYTLNDSIIYMKKNNINCSIQPSGSNFMIEETEDRISRFSHSLSENLFEILYDVHAKKNEVKEYEIKRKDKKVLMKVSKK